MMYLCAMGIIRRLALALPLLATSCSNAPSTGNRQASQSDQEPVYGDLTLIQGKTVYGFEMSAVVLCPKGRDNCAAPVNADGTDDMSRYCWLEFEDRARVDRERLHKVSPEAEDYGEFWMEGRGRIARDPRGFGHLAQYPCKVVMTNVGKFELGRPWFFVPPPDPVKNAR